MTQIYQNHKWELPLQQFFNVAFHEVVADHKNFGIGEIFQMGHHTNDVVFGYVRQKFANLCHPRVSGIIYKYKI